MGVDEAAPTADNEAEFLAAVATSEPATAREVAEIVGCSQRAADHRLRELYADDKVEPESVGTVLIWRLAEELEETRASPQ